MYAPPTEMPISESLKRVLGGAVRLRNEMQQRKVQPLHLLAAALAEDSSKSVQVFRKAGITSESVRKALQDEAAAERKPLITVGAATPVPITTNSPVYSSRTRNVNYLARLKARMRGSGSIEVEDLLVAWLIEDQGDFLDALSETPGIGIDITQVDLRPHPPALARNLADDLLARVEALCSRSEPLPPNAAIPMSETVKRIFALADLLREALQQDEITPLHLLATMLEEESSKAVQAFREAGITAKMALEAAKTGAE